jgi:hypothetical protein
MPHAESRAAVEQAHTRRVVTVTEFPVVQHRHLNGEIVSVRLRRVSGEFRTVCVGCGTEFLYRKPRPSRVVHHKSPLLPELKGNYDDPESYR